MPGIFGIIGPDVSCASCDPTQVQIGELIHNVEILPGGVIERFTNCKFLKDKVFEGDPDLFIAIDGIILNLHDLQLELGVQSAFQALKRQYQNRGGEFVRELRGDFCGCLYDKREDEWLVFTNATSSKPVFYFDDEVFIFSSKIRRITKTLSLMGRRYNLDQLGAYFLLTYGFMLHDHTLVSEIKKLQPGCYLTYSNGSHRIVQYHCFGSEPRHHGSEDEIIENLDSLFQTAVKTEYNKDLEYGYQHFATLSGGLDSRMNVMVADEMGFGPSMNFTFSQSNYWDELIAKKIAGDLGNTFVFFALDAGNYLKDVDGPVLANDGIVLYAGSAHLFAALRAINCSSFGMLHTGQLGDAVLGSYLTAPGQAASAVWRGAYSSRLLDRIVNDVEMIAGQYESEELFLLYNRGFNGILNGNWTSYHITEVTSPFLTTDFLEYCLRIPRELRLGSRLYLKWILEKHPRTGNYVWEKTKAKPRLPRSSQSLNLRRVWRAMRRKARRARSALSLSGRASIPKPDSMNPFQYWYYTNASLRDFVDSYISTNISVLDDHPKLRDDCLTLTNTGTCREKLQVITLLAAVKLHFYQDVREQLC
jgi:asparagine synthase (glutamine-hydrolysing)